jgi:hypothetical protein
MIVTTKPCLACGKVSEVEVDNAAYRDYTERGMLIQEVFPDKDAGWRELLITGTHPECWKKIFADEEDV